MADQGDHLAQLLEQLRDQGVSAETFELIRMAL